MTKHAVAGDMQASSQTHGFPVVTDTDPANYLDTQTLAGGKGYFHTENAPTHATDGSATNPDGDQETPLVRASRADASAASSDQYETWTNTALQDELDRRGIEAPPRANKAQLVAALRGE